MSPRGSKELGHIASANPRDSLPLATLQVLGKCEGKNRKLNVVGNPLKENIETILNFREEETPFHVQGAIVYNRLSMLAYA